eukprot:CAMPEP_0116079246 /NCGR_PEP_ID=MMETSP0327-20121206/1041_1 /TAXON_ID=44447 /ORGANISM="Pseudo-nitzschia delicatissima, Strain B596" /LENGTH=51 /DNA_ID=CAMNT_0003569861 /DNA_START=476 /DNA_END=631 /DNA_ORIENTATION=+
MLVISDTAEVCQEFRGWLKDSAKANVYFMSVAAAVFQEFKGWLNCTASKNM